MCETWEQFDQTCAWFIREGAPLEFWRKVDATDVPVIMRRSMASYLDVDGSVRTINHNVQRGAGYSVDVEEINVMYEVHAPEFIR